jgi:hypothetical protein
LVFFPCRCSRTKRWCRQPKKQRTV